MGVIFEKINKFLNEVAYAVLFLLPHSPFRESINNIQQAEWIGYLNYFVPVGTFVAIGSVWVSAIAVFYVYQIILRWAKAVG